MDINWDRPKDTITVSEYIRKARQDARKYIKRIYKIWE
jgi:hypothetical protein